MSMVQKKQMWITWFTYILQVVKTKHEQDKQVKTKIAHAGRHVSRMFPFYNQHHHVKWRRNTLFEYFSIPSNGHDRDSLLNNYIEMYSN